MNISRASREFLIICCIGAKHSERYNRVYRKLLRRFLEANGDQDVRELSRLHIQFYLAMELGDVENVRTRPVSVLRHECDLLLKFYKWLAIQGYSKPLHPKHLQSPFRHRKGDFS